MTHRRRRITCLVRGGRSCPLELHLHRIRPDQPESQETRIRPPRQDITRMVGRQAQGDFRAKATGSPAGPVTWPTTKFGSTAQAKAIFSPGRAGLRCQQIMEYSTVTRMIKLQIRTRSLLQHIGTNSCARPSCDSSLRTTRTLPSLYCGRQIFTILCPAHFDQLGVPRSYRNIRCSSSLR